MSTDENMKKFLLLGVSVLISMALHSQEDSTYVEEEFDFSDFELATEPAKAFCNNKVLGQSPTTLVGGYYDIMPEHSLTAGTPVNAENVDISNEGTINSSQRLALTTNLPIVSRNNIVIKFNLIY